MAKKNSLKDKKNQHYVPKSYLKGFTIDGEKSLIYCFNKELIKFSKNTSSINKICVKDYYYYQQEGDGFEHIKLEDEIAKVEKMGNDIIMEVD